MTFERELRNLAIAISAYLLMFVIVLTLNFGTKFSFLRPHRWVGSDSLYHLSIAREITLQNRLPRLIDRFILPEKYTYPPLFHLILSKIARRNEWKAQRIGAAFDTLIVLVIGVFTSIIAGWPTALIASALFAVSPYSLTSYLGCMPESLANFFLTISILSNFIWSFTTTNPYLQVAFYLASLLASTCVLLTHRSTSQSLFVITSAEGFYFHNWFFFLLLLFSLIMALLITRGQYKIIFEDHLRFILFSARNWINSSRQQLRLRGSLDLIKKTWSPRSVALNFPVIFFLPFFYILQRDPFTIYITIWAVSALLLYLGWMIGFGYRHLGSSVPALCILSSLAASSLPLVTLMVGISMFGCYLVKYYYVIRSGRAFVDEDYISAIRFLNSICNEKDLVLSLPLSASYNLFFFAHCKILQGSGGTSDGALFNSQLHEDIDSKNNVAKIVKKYQPKYMLMTKSTKVSFQGRVRYENERYVVFESSDLSN